MARKEKTGVALDMYVMSKCYDLLMQLPNDGRRESTVEWLQKRVQGTAALKEAANG